MIADEIRNKTNSEFELDRAKELLNLVKIAHDRFDYSKKHPTYKWQADLSTIETTTGRYEILTNLGFAGYFFLKRRRVPFGFIARREISPGRFEIFVVFRGTVNPEEWISNLKLVQSSYEKKDDPELSINPQNCTIPPDQIGKIHRGFYLTYTRPDAGSLLDLIIDLSLGNNHDSMRDTIEKTLSNAQLCPPESQVFVTGHSLGGALANLSALHIHASNAIPFDFPILYAFANPRVGDRQFAQHFKHLECYRIANSEDLVTTIPLPSLLLAASRIPLREIAVPSAKSLTGKPEYEHVGQSVYFTIQTGSVAGNHIIPTYQDALAQMNTANG